MTHTGSIVQANEGDIRSEVQRWVGRCGQGCEYVVIATGRRPIPCGVHDLPLTLVED